MNMTRNFVLVTLLLLTLAIIGCQRGSDVTGTWKNANLPETVEFKKDHTGVFRVEKNPSLPFTWKELPDGRIQVDVNFMGNINTLYGKLEKNTFILAGRGEQAVYNKVK